MKKAKNIKRLSQALRLWEDVCFLTQKHVEVLAKNHSAEVNPKYKAGAVYHFNEFRSYVLKNAITNHFDSQRFIDDEKDQGYLIGETWSVPANLFSWNKYSRKVFHLTANLQTLLSATSLDGICWNEIKWPFKSFALTLEEPIEDPALKLKFDCILVSEIGGIEKTPQGEIMNFLLLSTKLDEYQPLDREKIEKLSTPRKWNQNKIEKKLKNMTHGYISSFFVTTKGEFGINTDPISKPFAESWKEERGKIENTEDPDPYRDYSSIDKIKHLIPSICLFLETLPPKKTIRQEEEEQTDRFVLDIGFPDPTAVNKEENIFTIACENTLSRESQLLISEIKNSRIYREKKVHWRRGHWRRLGLNENGSYIKKIWIRPAFINAHRLPEKTLPSGGKTVLA